MLNEGETNGKCTQCPRKCGIDRDKKNGYCGVKNEYKIARAGLHLWEEPCISCGKGSGTVFFSGCPMHCVFCQNYEISGGDRGKVLSESELESIIFSLVEKGAENINLVSPTQYALRLSRLLERIKPELSVPVVYNTGGYESVETLKRLDGLIDIYLPDVKYFSPEISARYSGAPDYFEKTLSALLEMKRQTGSAVFSENGEKMLRGIIIRHLVLPSHRRDSMAIFDALAENFTPSEVYVSIMRQYFPTAKSAEFPEINRKLTTLEYESVVKHVRELGFVNGFTQGKDSASGEFVPDFDMN